MCYIGAVYIYIIVLYKGSIRKIEKRWTPHTLNPKLLFRQSPEGLVWPCLGERAVGKGGLDSRFRT